MRADKVIESGDEWAILALGCRERDGAADPPRGSAPHPPLRLSQNVPAAAAAVAAGPQCRLDGAERLEVCKV